MSKTESVSKGREGGFGYLYVESISGFVLSTLCTMFYLTTALLGVYLHVRGNLHLVLSCQHSHSLIRISSLGVTNLALLLRIG